MKSTAILAVATAFLLFGCGGGGETGNVGPTTLSDAVDSVTDTRSVARTQIVDLVQSARIGRDGVVVSTNGAVTRVEAVRIPFSGQNRVEATVMRTGMPDFTVDPNDVFRVPPIPGSLVDPYDLHLPTRDSVTRRTFSRTSSTATLGTVTVDWVSRMRDDYLAFGYWLRAEPGTPVSIESGAFVDGPEIGGNISLPDLGRSGNRTATYTGYATGLMAGERGSDLYWVGEFIGEAELTAVFENDGSRGTIEGCIPCSSFGLPFFEVTLTQFDRAGNVDRPEITYTPLHRIIFGSERIGGDGSFGGPTVTISGGGITTSSGQWTGQFSGRQLGENPRLVGVAFAGEGVDTGTNEKVAYVGAFGAGKN